MLVWKLIENIRISKDKGSIFKVPVYWGHEPGHGKALSADPNISSSWLQYPPPWINSVVLYSDYKDEFYGNWNLWL